MKGDPTRCRYLHQTDGNGIYLDLDSTEVLSDITIDECQFKVTLHPLLDGCCVLWFRDTRTELPFEALGHFSRFDKRQTVYFAARYATSDALRQEIENRRFEQRITGLSREFFADVARRRHSDKTEAFRSLFNLDDEIDASALARRRRIMARKFHPDAGGDDATMALINEAYDHLLETAHL